MNKQALLPILGIVLLAHAPSSALGQQLVAGDAIRVRASQSAEPGLQWTEGRVVRLTSDTLWYQASGSVSPISLDAAEIQRGTGRKRWRNGLGICALAGGAVGALVAYRSFEPRFGYKDLGEALFCPFLGCEPDTQLNSRKDETAGGAFLGALIGGTAGFLVGKMLGGWETVELDQITVGAGNLGVSLSIRR